MYRIVFTKGNEHIYFEITDKTKALEQFSILKKEVLRLVSLKKAASVTMSVTSITGATEWAFDGYEET